MTLVPLPLRFDRSSFYICPTKSERVDLVNRTYSTTFKVTRIGLITQSGNNMSAS